MNITQQFKNIFGSSPDLVAAAPGRVNVIGEHIDYSQGFVLPFAIKDQTLAAVGKRSDRKIGIASLQRKSEIHTFALDDIYPPVKLGWENYVLGVIWSLGSENPLECGVDILVDGQVPLGAGLSSSAALECSIATALNELFDFDLPLEYLARATQRAENDFVGMPCGIMDQSVSLMANEGFALLLDCRDLSTRQIPFDLAASGLELLIVDTRVHHALVEGGYASRRAACDSVVSKLGIPSLRGLSLVQLVALKDQLSELEFMRARHAVTEMNRVLDAVKALETKDFLLLGQIINNSHASLRDDYQVSCPELDCAVSAALSAGALGARMVGGGFGGSAIALVRAEDAKNVSHKIQEEFLARGYEAPRFFASLPSRGAHVIQRR